MKLAVFDIDGTLTGTNSVDSACFVRAFAIAHAVTEINTNWAEYPHTTDSGITQHIFQERRGYDPDSVEVSKLVQCFVGLLEEQYLTDPASFIEIPGASAALHRLRQGSEWAVAIATGCWRESAHLKLRAAGIEADGFPSAYAEDGFAREQILQAAVARALAHYRQGNFDKIVSVGDGIWDVRAAARLNLAFLGIGEADHETRLRRAGAGHVLADFTDYGRLIEYLNAAEVPGS